jgi:hypothetical protein
MQVLKSIFTGLLRLFQPMSSLIVLCLCLIKQNSRVAGILLVRLLCVPNNNNCAFLSHFLELFYHIFY